MNITIIAVGKLKEEFMKQGIEEYHKRMTTLANVKIVEVADEKAPDQLSEKEQEQVKDKEGDRILAKIPQQAYVIVLDLKGEMLSSESLAEKLNQLALHGKSKVVFVIGGSLGISESVRRRADFLWSMSKLTFPHQLIRVIVMEQVYRAFQINRGSSYHK
ncbi:23S rRNA (pseudouridine(1915)-N(3))-methyltransferase RlmH [Bacillus sp. FJAT-44742]|uniref:23S rRNA (pseudouridine(1915)-N(3))-methyltransferase RlmH n=1 Tax=Bacillus sp. FJAT-44742 TaxID=2014005 RepID=UPI000C245D52|nr:23S rRNA (pseudouridine(1915)-N(3))-methyltransferase RlmH [Bacillus sp. FJAT-44742]